MKKWAVAIVLIIMGLCLVIFHRGHGLVFQIGGSQVFTPVVLLLILYPLIFIARELHFYLKSLKLNRKPIPTFRHREFSSVQDRRKHDAICMVLALVMKAMGFAFIVFYPITVLLNLNEPGGIREVFGLTAFVMCSIFGSLLSLLSVTANYPAQRRLAKNRPDDPYVFAPRVFRFAKVSADLDPEKIKGSLVDLKYDPIKQEISDEGFKLYGFKKVQISGERQPYKEFDLLIVAQGSGSHWDVALSSATVQLFEFRNGEYIFDALDDVAAVLGWKLEMSKSVGRG